MVTTLGHREIVILRGKGSIWRRCVVRGMSFCVAGAVFGTLYIILFFIRNSALYTLNFILHTFRSPLPTLRFTLYTVDSTLYSTL